MKTIRVSVRVVLITLCMTALYSLSHGATLGAMACATFTATQDQTGYGATCDDATADAVSKLNAFDRNGWCNNWCTGSGACQIEHYTVDSACAWNGTQYQVTLEQDWGCTTMCGH